MRRYNPLALKGFGLQETGARQFQCSQLPKQLILTAGHQTAAPVRTRALCWRASFKVGGPGVALLNW